MYMYMTGKRNRGQGKQKKKSGNKLKESVFNRKLRVGVAFRSSNFGNMVSHSRRGSHRQIPPIPFQPA